MQWIAIPRTWIDGMMLMRFTPKNPAPEAVALMLVCARIQAGDPMTRRQVADWAGCTAYKARQIIKEASDWMATGGTFDRFSTEYQDKNRPGFDRKSTLHARSFYTEHYTHITRERGGYPLNPLRI